MTRDDYKNFKVGDILYECEMGMNIEFEITTKPVCTTMNVFDKDRKHWVWLAKNTQNGEEISYAVTEGISSTYGPRIYDQPEYLHRKIVGDTVEFFHKLVGENED